MRKLAPALLVAAIACAACTVPVFDPGVIPAIATIQASHVLGVTAPSAGPKASPPYDVERDSFVFLPERTAGALLRTVNGLIPSGFVIGRYEDDSWNRIWYQWIEGDSVSWMGTPAGFHENDGIPWQWPVMLKNGPYLGAVIFEESLTRLELLYADTSTESCDWYPSWGAYPLADDIMLDLSLGFAPIVVGLAVKPLDLPTKDRVHVLVRNSGPLFTEAKAEIDGAANPAFAATFGETNYTLDFLPPLPRHLAYFHDSQNSSSFAQWMDWDGWRTWTWWGTIAGESARLAGVTHRIDAVLTTRPEWGWNPGSYLFSSEKQVGRLYRWNGVDTETLVAEFPLGSLAFIGEMYVDGEWQLVFSRKVLSGDSMSFEVRGIFTKDLIEKFGL